MLSENTTTDTETDTDAEAEAEGKAICFSKADPGQSPTRPMPSRVPEVCGSRQTDKPSVSSTRQKPSRTRKWGWKGWRPPPPTHTPER